MIAKNWSRRTIAQYLEAFGTVDGTKWTEHTKHTKNFDHRYGIAAKGRGEGVNSIT